MTINKISDHVAHPFANTRVVLYENEITFFDLVNCVVQCTICVPLKKQLCLSSVDSTEPPILSHSLNQNYAVSFLVVRLAKSLDAAAINAAVIIKLMTARGCAI